MSASAIRAGNAYVEIGARDKTGQVLRGVEKRLRSFGGTALRIGGVIGGLGAAGLAAFVPMINAAAEMEETMNKFNVVFGKNADSVKAWSDEFAKSVGRSKQQTADFLASTQDLLQPMGFASDEATELSKSITGLAVDLASFNNMADADVLRDLHAALTGSGEVMKKYGVIVSEAAVKQQLLNDGLDPKAATEQQKAQARLAIILAGTTAAQGDALRSAGSYTNQMKRLKAILHDTKVVIGNAVLPIVTKFVSKLADGAALIAGWIEKNRGLVTVLGGIAIAATIAGGMIAAFGVALSVVAGIVSAVGTIFGVLSTVIGAIGWPIAAVVVAVGALSAGLVAMGGYALWASGVLGSVAKSIRDNWANISAHVTATLKGIATALRSGDITKAAEILWAGLRLAFWSGTSELMKAFARLPVYMIRVSVDLLDLLSKNFQNFFLTLAKSLSAVASGDIAGLLAGAAGFVMDTTFELDVSFDVGDNIAKAKADLDRLLADVGVKVGEAAAGDSGAASEPQTDPTADKAREEMEQAADKMGAMLDKIQSGELAPHASEVTDAQEALKKAAAQVQKTFSEPVTLSVGQPEPLAFEGLDVTGSAAAVEGAGAGAGGGGVQGTTSAFAAVLAGFQRGDSVPQQQLEELRKNNDLLSQQNRILKDEGVGGLKIA